MSPNSNWNPSVHTTFGTSLHTPFSMLKNINKQLKALKLDNKQITKYVQKQFYRSQHKTNKTYPDKLYKQKTLFCKTVQK